MKNLLHLVFSCLLAITLANNNCRDILQDSNIKQIQWPYLKQCLAIVSGEDLSKDIGENIWRLVKVVSISVPQSQTNAFDTIENIPADCYQYMGYTLTVIPVQELWNVSMENIDVVEAFGAIRSSDSLHKQDAFMPEQLNVLAHKVRRQWLGKNPQTYSEYDLKAMGEILCYLNVTDIDNIHADAFKEAAEWIGLIEKCPQDRLKALANLAKRPEAFGAPENWSKLEVSIIGNIINGLSRTEINTIAKDKLQLNHFYNTKTNLSNKQTFSHKTTKNGTSPSSSVPSSSIRNLTQLESVENN